jgi:branched-chain amino acid transport system substrate-binding protein
VAKRNPARKPGRVSALAAGALAALAPAWGAPACAGTLDVVVGVSAGTTGPRALVGQDFTNGVVLALEDLNARNARIGSDRVVWKVLAEDDQADPRQAAVVAQKFIDAKVSGVVGPDTSGGAYAAERLLDAASIPMMMASATDSRLGRVGAKSFFRVIADDAVVSRALADYAQQELHLRSVALIDDRTAFGQGLADAFARDATARGMRVVAREYTTDKASDFSAVLTRVRSLHPDAIMFGGVVTQAGLMLRQMERLGLDMPLLGGDGACVAELPKLAGGAVRHMVCGDGRLPLERTPGGVAWRQRYERRFGPEAFQAYSPYSYDATMVLAQAMQRAGSAEPARFLPALRATDHDGITREHLRFEPNGEVADPQVTISVYRDGLKVPVKVQTVAR